VTQFRQLPDPAGLDGGARGGRDEEESGAGTRTAGHPRCFQILAGGGRAPPDTKRREGTREDRERRKESGEEGFYGWYKHRVDSRCDQVCRFAI